MDRVKERLHETKRHGSMMFPFNIYPCTIPGDFPTVPLHWQESAELIYIKKGSGLVKMGTEMIRAEEGDIYMIPPGTLHELKALPGISMEYENIIFDVDFLGAGAADICAQEYLVPFAAGQLIPAEVLRVGKERYAEAASCLREAEDLCEKKERGYELGVKGSMLRLLSVLLCSGLEKPKPDSGDTERLKQVLSKIEREYTGNLSITEMAEACGCSASHFMRWFKKMTGTSFGAYLNERRLAVAAEKLRKTDEKILLIAESVGFENLSNFNRQFKTRYGMTPREYRNN